MPIQKITSGILDTASVFSSPTISGNLSLDSTGTTGVRVPSANTMAFHTAGTEDMRITSNGWIGVGTTTPANTFTVKGTGIVAERDIDTDRLIATYNDINIFANATGGTNHNVFTLRQSNNTTSNNRLRVTATGLFQFDSGYGDIATAYGCRAWVNFNGTGTPAIRSSGNVSSITDNGTGDYTVNFSNAMTDANYIACANASFVASGAANAMIRQSTVVSPFLTTSVRLNTGYSYSPGYALEDTEVGQISIFR
jgi:hypothetical protein